MGHYFCSRCHGHTQCQPPHCYSAPERYLNLWCGPYSKDQDPWPKYTWLSPCLLRAHHAHNTVPIPGTPKNIYVCVRHLSVSTLKKCLCYSLHKICECPWHLIHQLYYLEEFFFFSILTNFLKLYGVQQSAKQEVHVHTNQFHHFGAESLHFFRLLFIMGIQACWSCTSICRN